MRQRFVVHPKTGDLIPRDEYYAQSGPEPRLHFISDNCDLVSMADGQHYTSKSRYYADLKARGYEILGNEKPVSKPYRPDERAIERVVGEVMRGDYQE